MARGWPVFLLATDGPEGKIPPKNCALCDPRTGERHDREVCTCLLCHAFYAATTDPARFDLMLAALPDGYLAIRTGSRARLLVVDVEKKAIDEAGGLDEFYEAWESTTGIPLGQTLTASSVAGGVHLYYSLPPDVEVTSGRVLPNVDVKAEGGLVGAVGSRSGRRHWLNESVPVAPCPPELLTWLSTTRRRGTAGSGGGSGPAGAPEGYDYERFLRDGCPGGHRDYFFNDLLFRARVRGADLAELTELAHTHWQRCAQPPATQWFMPWEHVEYKVERVFHEVQPTALPEGQSRWVSLLRPNETPDERDRRTVEGDPPPLDEDLTPTGNAHRFVRLFGDKTLYVPGLGWYTWNETRWVLDELNDVFDATQHVLREIRREQAEAGPDRDGEYRNFYRASSAMTARAAMLTGAAADPRMKTLATSLDADPLLLVVPQGTLDLRTQSLRESRASDRNTQVIGVSYDPRAGCEGWLRHVRRITAHADGTPDPELELFIQRWFGYSLTGSVAEQKFFFGYGDGANGKNVTVEVLLGLMGTYAIRGSSKLLMGDGREHETVIADLAGVRVAFIDETPRGRINEARIKELTGSGQVRARKISQDSFEFPLRTKLWIAGNNKPRVDETSEGFWRRLDLVPFDVFIPKGERVRDLAALLLRDEGPGILNWALTGLAAYLERGLEPPARVREASRLYRESENTTGQFIGDTFDLDSPERVWHPNRLLVGLHRLWCETEGIKKTLSMAQLAQDLAHDKRFTPGKPRRVYWWPEVTNSKTERGWDGPPLLARPPAHLRWSTTRGGEDAGRYTVGHG